MATDITTSKTLSEAPIAPVHEALWNEAPKLRTDEEPQLASRRELSWTNITWLSICHIGLLAAPFTFTWQALVMLVFMHWVCGGVGICLGFHRFLTHRSFETYRPVRWFLALVGGLAGEGTALDWVSNHRKHHAHSDQEGDPHSPRDGAWWSHLVWLMFQLPRHEMDAHHKKWAPDLMRDPMLSAVGMLFLPSHFILAGLLAALGYWMGGASMALSFLVWGTFVRLVLVLHSTWFVNSASHMWGYRNYKTTDDSRNNWWVALMTYGEGWHNNHHAYPRMANHGHRWWEFDMTFRAIRLMQWMGLAWNVVDYKQRRRQEAE